MWGLLLVGASSCVTAFAPASGFAPARSIAPSLSCLAPASFAPALSRSSSRAGSRRVASGALRMQQTLGKKSTAKEVLDFFKTDLRGKTAVITGANSGIGLETAKALASVGCRVIMACRNVEAARAAVDSEVKTAGVGGYAVAEPNVAVKELDLNDLRSVQKFADELLADGERIDFLINNAGIMALKTRELTQQGFEKQIGVNHFGHFHLTSLLLPAMQAQKEPCRVVTLSSVAHESFGELDLDNLHYAEGRKYSSWGAYGQSKLANLLFTKGLHARLVSEPGNMVSALAVHPGMIRTELWREQASWFNTLLLPIMKDKSIPQVVCLPLPPLPRLSVPARSHPSTAPPSRHHARPPEAYTHTHTHKHTHTHTHKHTHAHTHIRSCT